MDTYLFISQTDPIADILLTFFYIFMICNFIEKRKQTRLLKAIVKCNENNSECDDEAAEESDEEVVDDEAVEESEEVVEEDAAEESDEDYSEVVEEDYSDEIQ